MKMIPKNAYGGIFLLCAFFSFMPMVNAEEWDKKYVASCTYVQNPPELDIPREYQEKVCACLFQNVRLNPAWGTLSDVDLANGLAELDARRATLRVRQEKPKPFTGRFDNTEFSQQIALLSLNGILPATKNPAIVQCLNDEHKKTPAENIPTGALE